MTENEHQEGIVHAKFSVAMVATCIDGVNEFENTRILLVKDRASGKLSQVTGKDLTKGKVFEHPLIAIEREWKEETNLPFEFITSPKLTESILIPKDDYISVGFIFSGQLPPYLGQKLKTPIQVFNDEDVETVGLYTFTEVVSLLNNWRQAIRHPELNARTLMKWCNSVLVGHNTELPIGGKDNLFTDTDFGFNFPQVSIQF